jgi:hypothetical protein
MKMATKSYVMVQSGKTNETLYGVGVVVNPAAAVPVVVGSVYMVDGDVLLPLRAHAHTQSVPLPSFDSDEKIRDSNNTIP